MVNDFLYVYKSSFEESLAVIKNKLWILFVPLLGSVAYYFIVDLLTGLGLLSGPISPYLARFIYSLILSQVFFQLNRAIHRNSISPYKFQDGFILYLIDIYIARFLIFLINVLASLIMVNPRISLLVNLAIYFILNPIGEIIYIRGFRSIREITYIWDFIKENWYLWLVHSGLFLLYKILVFSQTNIVLMEMYMFSIPTILANPPYIIFVLLETLYFIFRGVMFDKLQASSRRKREYMGGF